MIKRLIFTAVMLLFFSLSWAQETSYYTSGLDKYRKGVELFEKEKYASSRDVFEDFIEHNTKQAKKLIVDAHYYRALCAVELFNNDAEFLLSHFLVEFPESPRIKELYFVMGNFQYRKKRYSKAIKWYKQVDQFELLDLQKEEYLFKVGYSYFMRKKMELASENFLKIKDGEGKYAVPAKYFYAHIAFADKKYETALKNFKALEDDDLFGPIVPYYIIQIYYYQDNNEEIISYAPMLLDSTSTRRVPEISRILGEAYYKTERFAQAVPYLLTYKEKGKEYTRADAYQLAYAYYRTNDYHLASKSFENIAKRKDSLSQNAYYHLADCYLKLDNKEKAMMAFQEAASLNIIPDVQEDAMYNYAKLSYELSYSPFNDAIKAIKDYLKTYPNSRHHDEAYNYLSEVFLSTQNYQLAIETIEEIGSKSPEITESYQKVTYYRALEYYVDAKYSQAIALFNKSIDNSKYNLKIRAMAKYWRAEARYKIGEYEKSFNDYNDFVLTSGAYGSEEFKDAHYNMGYALFKLHDYQKAIVWFRKYTDFTQSKKLTKIADAYNRVGDCYFISKNYNFAIDYYDKSIVLKRRNVDYALFQKSFSLGLLKKYPQEIEQLQQLTQEFTSSAYLDDAVFEMANAYKFLNSNDAAIENYSRIINEFPSSDYRPKAFLQAGMLDYNANKDDAAILKFKTLISNYPKSDEAQKALLIMRNIYIDINDVDSYINFANNNSVETEVSKIEADSLTYISAENLYMEGNCEASEPGFVKYINNYPQGRYLLNAHYFKSDCEFAKKEYDSALESYDYIISQSANEYTEDALLKAAFITYSDSNYTRAAELYAKLIKNSSNNTSLTAARVGLMRTKFRLKDYPEAIKSAMKVLMISEESELLKREVHYVIGKSFFETGDMDGAYAEFMLIADQSKSEQGAEANYRMIKIDYDKKDYDKAIKQINTFKASGSPHQFWVAKSFMIWSDIFKAKEDYFMAKAILESIIKNYQNNTDGIVKTAQEGVYNIEQEEIDEQELEDAADEDIEINMNIDIKDDKLFEEDDDNKKDSVVVKNMELPQVVPEKSESQHTLKTNAPSELLKSGDNVEKSKTQIIEERPINGTAKENENIEIEPDKVVPEKEKPNISESEENIKETENKEEVENEK